MTTYGERLRALRKEKGIGITDLAARVGITRAYFHSLENGTTHEPSALKMCEIARELGTTVEYLMGYSSYETAPEAAPIEDPY